MHTPATLLVVHGSLDQLGSVPFRIVLPVDAVPFVESRPLLRMSRLGCVAIPSAVAWILVVAAVVGAGSSRDRFVSQGAGRLDPGASSSRGAGSSRDLLLSQGSGLRVVGISHRVSDSVEDGSRYRSDSFPPLGTVAGRSRLSLRISKAISCFARYPHRRPAGLSASENGCLDINQVRLHWGLYQGISR